MSTLTRPRYIQVVRKFLSYKPSSNFASPPERTLSRFQFHTSTFLKVKEMDIKMPSSLQIKDKSYIVKWYKKEGDTIAPGDHLCILETGKDALLEVEEEGVIVYSSFPSRINFYVSVSPAMPKGTVVKRCITHEDLVAPGDVLCKIKTD